MLYRKFVECSNEHHNAGVLVVVVTTLKLFKFLLKEYTEWMGLNYNGNTFRENITNSVQLLQDYKRRRIQIRKSGRWDEEF